AATCAAAAAKRAPGAGIRSEEFPRADASRRQPRRPRRTDRARRGAPGNRSRARRRRPLPADPSGLVDQRVRGQREELDVLVVGGDFLEELRTLVVLAFAVDGFQLCELLGEELLEK